MVESEGGVAPGKHWFALRTRPHKECLAQGLLRGQGVETCLPEARIAVWRRGQRQRKPFSPTICLRGLTRTVA
jgi:hypothetical protein